MSDKSVSPHLKALCLYVTLVHIYATLSVGLTLRLTPVKHGRLAFIFISITCFTWDQVQLQLEKNPGQSYKRTVILSSLDFRCDPSWCSVHLEKLVRLRKISSSNLLSLNPKSDNSIANQMNISQKKNSDQIKSSIMNSKLKCKLVELYPWL